MRIWGYIILIVGILFSILFLLANLHGAHIKVLPFVISLLLIFSGLKLVKSGKGILQTESPSMGISKEIYTEKIPMSHEIASVIKKQSARTWKIIRYLAFGYVIFFFALGALIGFSDKKTHDAIGLAVAFSIPGIMVALITVGAFWLLAARPVRKDLNEKNYLRTKGPIKVIPFLGGAILQLADRAFLINGRNGIKELSTVNEGTIDYSPHSHVIFAAWDKQGHSVYRLEGYNIELNNKI